jgi:predicted ATP-grasp superfamily ATP-dependent carboligase
MKILIPELLERNVLAAVRALGREENELVLAMPRRQVTQNEPKGLSRYVTRAVNIRSPHNTPDGFISDLEHLLERENYDVILPFTHSTVLPVSFYKSRLEKFTRVPVADYTILCKAHDKYQATKIAQSIGVSIPATFYPQSRDELFAMKDEIPFPCLVKARQGCGIGLTIQFAKDFTEVVNGYEKITSQHSNPPVDDFSRPIIQEYIPGGIHDALYIYANGNCRGAVTQQRVVMYPLQGGTGVVNRTTDDPALLELGKRLLDTLGWHGPSQVEFKLDPRDGKYKLMEINPKFWGTLACSMAAGMNFPKMACEIAMKGDVAPQFEYKVGVTYHWRFPDELYTCVEAPSLKRFGGLLQIGQPDVYYDWDWADVMPDIMRAGFTFKTILLNRKRILPARFDLEELALQRPPAVQKHRL